MKHEVAHVKSFPRGSLLCALLLATVAAGAESSTLIGTVVDGESQKPLADVLVVATSLEFEGERVVVTDARGNYSIPGLPAGAYALRFEKDRYKGCTRMDLQLRVNRTTRHDVRLFSKGSSGCESTAGVTTDSGVDAHIHEEFIQHIVVTCSFRRLLPGCTGTDGVLARTPSWMLSRMPVLVADGTPQLVYRAPSADRCSPDFGTR